MTRFPEEWLDAKLANIRRWKAEEATRSAAKQSTSGSTEGRAPEIAPFGTTGVEGEIRELTRQPGGTPGGTRRATKWADLATALPVPQLESSPARSPSTAGAASPAGVPSNPVAAPAPDDVQWICAPCGARHCNGMRDEHIATWHIGRCDICADETAVTEPRDFGYLKATKADAGDRRSGTPAPNREVAPAVRIRAPDAASSGTHKYRNKPTDGYHSKREAKRAAALRLMQESGQIQGLREQVEFLLIPRQTRPDGTAERSCSYWADFTYDEWASGEWRRVVEDVKGMRTREYVLKRKLMLMVHGVAIREV